MSRVNVDEIIEQKQKRETEEKQFELSEIVDRRVDSWKSPEIDKLAEALSKVQGELEGAKKESKNPYFD